MAEYVITKVSIGVDGVESSDLLTNIVFPDRVSAIAYTRMHIEKNGYDISLGEYDFPVTGNIEVTIPKGPIIQEIYQLVELEQKYSTRYNEVLEEVQSWTMEILGRKLGGDQ